MGCRESRELDLAAVVDDIQTQIGEYARNFYSDCHFGAFFVRNTCFVTFFLQKRLHSTFHGAFSAFLPTCSTFNDPSDAQNWGRRL